MRIFVGITGASGAICAKRFLKAVQEVAEVHGCITPSAYEIVKHELDESIDALFHKLYECDDIAAPVASGTARYDAMVIIPASMNTVSKLACGISDNLITRAAQVFIKEGRKTIVVPRETPLSAIHLESLLKLAQNGVRVIPAAPAFYHKPETIEEVADFVIQKVADSLGLNMDIIRRWG